MAIRTPTIHSPGKINTFAQPLSKSFLNIEDKSRSNLFVWRGQFSPQLVERLLRAYCPSGAAVLDPFCGSGTTLYEAGNLGLQGYGFELNPSAWILSRTYQLINFDKKQRADILDLVRNRLGQYFPEGIFFHVDNSKIPLDRFSKFLSFCHHDCTEEELIVIEAMVILLDLFEKELSVKLLYDFFHKLSTIVMKLPYSSLPIVAKLADARSLPLYDKSIDFVLTSPPYINVFNYHQNYRRSAEILGWDLLKVAKSEIGSNRANRGNRFLTVIQYCIDMALMLLELNRVCNPNARIILVVGCESNVLGVPFYNADMITNMALQTGLFSLEQCQKREFKNKFGQTIREDLLHFSPTGSTCAVNEADAIAKTVAHKALNNGLHRVPEKNKKTLMEAIDKIGNITGTPIYKVEEDRKVSTL